MRQLIIPLQCSTCAYYARGMCGCGEGRYFGETVQADEFCRDWRERDGQAQP